MKVDEIISEGPTDWWINAKRKVADKAAGWAAAKQKVQGAGELDKYAQTVFNGWNSYIGKVGLDYQKKPKTFKQQLDIYVQTMMQKEKVISGKGDLSTAKGQMQYIRDLIQKHWSFVPKPTTPKAATPAEQPSATQPATQPEAPKQQQSGPVAKATPKSGNMIVVISPSNQGRYILNDKGEWINNAGGKITQQSSIDYLYKVADKSGKEVPFVDPTAGKKPSKENIVTDRSRAKATIAQAKARNR